MKRLFPQFSTRSFRPSTTGNKMNRSLSRLSRRSQLALVLISFVAAATLITFVVSASRNTNSGTGVSPVNQDTRAPKPLTRIANRRTMTPMSPMFAPVVTATLTDNITAATKVIPGGTINYTAVISNTTTDATGVQYTDTLDANTTLVGGSTSVSPVTVNDSYTATGNVSISVPAVSGVTANDYFGLNPLVPTENSIHGVIIEVSNGGLGLPSRLTSSNVT